MNEIPWLSETRYNTHSTVNVRWISSILDDYFQSSIGIDLAIRFQKDFQVANEWALYYQLTQLLLHRFDYYFTSKPSSRRQILCASMSLRQSGCSSPFMTMHSSLGFLVSGQQQHIGLPVLIPTFCLGFSCWRRVRICQVLLTKTFCDHDSFHGRIYREAPTRLTRLPCNDTHWSWCRLSLTHTDWLMILHSGFTLPIPFIHLLVLKWFRCNRSR